MKIREAQKRTNSKKPGKPKGLPGFLLKNTQIAPRQQPLRTKRGQCK